MSLRSESRETESVGERSSSGANSVTSDDSSERTTSKKSEVPRNTLKYSYEFLLKLQKSKLSKKPPDCLDRLRQECILRETWRSDRDKDSERDTEFPAALTKPPPSFRGGCKVDKAVLSDIPNPGSNSVKKSAASKGERRVGSGRLGSYNKDRESDYGYPQERSRRLFDHQGSSDPPKRSNGRYIESNSSRGGCGNNDDEPEWFTKGPTSQTDTIELGGFEDKSRKGRTPSPSVRKPTIVNNQPLEGVDLLKELYDMSGSTHRKPAIDFEQFFGSNGGGNSHSNKHSHKDETERDDMSNNNISNNHIDDDDVQQRHIDDEAVSVPHGGSRFMSKVFAKTFDDESLPSSKPASPPTYAKDLESSPRPVLEMLENSKESSSPSVSSLLRDMFPRSGGENRSAVIMGQCAAPKFDSLEDLLSRGSHQQQQQQQQQQNGGLMSVHPQMPTNTEMQSSMLSSNLLDVEKGVQGKNILELLLSGANVVNAPSTPHFAKSVEELEADLKMESSRMSSNNQAMFAPGATHQPHLDSGSMLPPVMGNGAIERSLGLMGDTQQSRDQSGPFGARHPFMNSMPLPQQQQQQQQQRPQQQAYQQTQPPQQQQQQANSTHNNASLDIMRLLMEGSSMPDRAQGKPYKQDVRNVPTSVLLQDKHRKSGQAAQPAGGPRPIVKSNKPPCPPQAAPSSVETGEDLLQRLFQQQQQEQQQQFAHQQYQQKQHPQQVYHSLHNQQQRYNSNNSGTSSSSNNRSYYGGGSFNGQSAQPQQQQQMRIGSSSRRPLTGGHSQRFPPSGLPPYGSSLMNNHAGNMMSSEASILSPDDALAKWFGNLSCNQPSLPVPTNVLRVEELERQSNGHRLRQAKPTAT